MQVTAFGILYFSILLYIFVRKDTKKIIYFTLLSMTLQCDNVVVLGDKGVGPQIFSSLSIVFYTFLAIREKKLYSKLLLSHGLYTCFLVYIILTDSDSITLNLFQIIIYLACGYSLYNLGKIISGNELLKIITNVIFFVLVIGPIQFLCSSMIIPKIILQPFFFNDSFSGADVQFYYTFPYHRLFSTFMEPSFCSTFLVGAIFFILQIGDKRIPHFRAILSILIIELILTFSSTGYAGLLVMLVFYVSKHLKGKYVPYYFVVILLGFLFYIVFKDSILNEVLFAKSQSSSAQAREWWNIAALEAFNSNPLWGTGFQSVRASSYLYSLLGETGIIGTSIYLSLSLSLYWPLLSKKTKKEFDMVNASRLFMLSVFICMAIACPDHNLCTFWFGFYIYSLNDYPQPADRFLL